MRSKIMCNAWLGMCLDVVRKHSGIMVQFTCVHTTLMKLNFSCLLALERVAEVKGHLWDPDCWPQAVG